MSVLNSRIFAGISAADDATYNDIPVYDDRHDDVVWEGRRGSAYGEGVRRDRTGSVNQDNDYVYSDRPKRASTWADDIYDRPTGSAARVNTFNTGASNASGRGRGGFDDDYVYSDSPRSPTGTMGSGKAGPGRPSAPKPLFQSKTGSLRDNEAVALFTFDGEQPGDLGFKKGDIIKVTKKTESTNDWWYVYIPFLSNFHADPRQDWYQRISNRNLPRQLCRDEEIDSSIIMHINFTSPTIYFPSTSPSHHTAR